MEEPGSRASEQWSMRLRVKGDVNLPFKTMSGESVKIWSFMEHLEVMLNVFTALGLNLF